eukprot:CAMPEP_0203712238 /NCGR_PEP_ID=MMETSP0091-20130426/69936_1 /ASSEMBLY_ACC=CAM_ASM_001089 /TAXON_ID=426623 /ORGANISM="Chaetoceros affinis, Strain CCMP159" /LENGTH=136 /DNA_ID=CAMNT_0050590209 /DNA_START=274 /DNA_END=684 /DNA_ORIENTATION=-
MECLHRFCGDCIQKCLRMGMKECPSCRVHIPSRRSLRPDKNYDTIMEGIYGDIEVLEAREAKEIKEFNRRNNMNNNYSQSQRVKKLQQTSQRPMLFSRQTNRKNRIIPKEQNQLFLLLKQLLIQMIRATQQRLPGV